LRFQIYTGKENKKEKVSEFIVKTFMEYLPKKEYILYIDSYNTSPSLFVYLIENNYDCIGMINKNRKGLPNILKDKKYISYQI